MSTTPPEGATPPGAPAYTAAAPRAVSGAPVAPADLLEHVGDGIVVIDRDWRYSYVNAKAGALLGRDPASLVGKGYHDEFPEARAQPFFAYYARAMETGEAVVFEAHYEPWDRWFENRIYPGPHGIAILFTEVTARRVQEAARREAEAQVEAICASVPVLIWTWDLTTGHVWRCGSLLEQLGYRADEVPGNGAEHAAWWLDHVHPDDRAHYVEQADAVRLAGRADRLREYRLRRADGGFATLAPDTRVLRDAAGRPVRAVGIVSDVSARAEADRARRESEERYALAARATNAAIWDWDIPAGTLSWSSGVSTIFGHAADAVPPGFDWWYERVHPEDRERVVAGLEAVVADAGGQEWRDAYRFRCADGRFAQVVDRGYVLRDAAGRAARMIGAIEDVTEQRELEARLQQAQRMEAVGQLAGGVAHDFNNLLTVITGNLEFVRDALSDGHPARPDVDQIAYASARARTLVRQLLTFSRKQPVQPRHVDIVELVRDTERLLRRVIGEEITFEVQPGPDRAPVCADPGQLQQVLVNLAVNARDAMLTALHGHPGTGGVLGIDVDEVDLPPSAAGAADGLAPGRYVRVRVRDSGHGMDEATRARVFEPFFTTKPVGAGTGLGLSTVFGIVSQAGGAITVDSTPGQGATFTILLPSAPAESDAAGALGGAGAGSAGSDRATVLLVEDEAPVRATARRMLERHGHRVIEAVDGADGFQKWRAHRDQVDALVSDVRMPGLDGIALAGALLADRPGLPVVLMSGYPTGAAPEDRALPASAVFVEKPFTAPALVEAIARARAAARQGAPGAR